MIRYLFLLFALVACAPTSPPAGMRTDFALPTAYTYVRNTPEFQTKDFIYDPYIRTVRFYPNLPVANARQLPPILRLGSPERLVLDFDELGSEVRDYAAQIIHCNADWSVSGLFATEYLEVYNEFNFFDYAFSINTKIPYIHYRFELPKVLASGNYILKVYREHDPEDLILTRRFMVYDPRVTIAAQQAMVSGSLTADTYQQIDLALNYQGLTLNYPTRQLTLHLRQNDRWDNAILSLPPTQVRDFKQEIEFRYFNLENAFLGGNEFRIFDMREINQIGLNVAGFESFPDKTTLRLTNDRPRNGWVYDRRFPDHNGRYFVQTLRTADPDTEGDYAYVTFTLEMPPLPESTPLYLIGELSDWRPQEEFRMRYDPDKKCYTTQALLKQGFYDYAYAVLDPDTQGFDTQPIEGSFRQTENVYDVLVYYRRLGGRADELVGYWRSADL
ncbi:MAG: DUF5103 domain-containing protein [Bernardetiaceae bacterium]